MKIVFNAWRDLVHPSAGGSEVIVDRLARGLDERGHDVVLRAGRPLTQHDYPVIDGGGTYTQYLTTPLHHHRHFPDADVVVDVVNGMGYYTPLFSRIPTVAMVHHVHTDQWGMYYPRIVAAAGRFQERHLVPLAYRRSLFTTVSPSTTAELKALGVPGDHIRELSISCHIDAVPAAPRSEEPTFVVIGRLTSHKRVDLILRHWEKVRPHVGGRLVIVGEGPERTRLEALAGSGVVFTGYVSETEKAHWLHRAWLLLHASPWEGWGLVITEAALAGVPSIGYDVVGVRDAIRDNETGRLATSDMTFVQHWLTLAQDREIRTALGNEARRIAGELATGGDLVEEFEEVLDETMTRAHRWRPRRPAASDATVTTARDRRATPGAALTCSIVIPAFEESARLPRLLDALAGVVDRSVTECIVVDDGSTDGTDVVAAANLREWPASTVIRFDRNRGKGAALRAGVEAARGQHIVFMDADLATDLSALPAVLAALADHHVALGSRAHPEAVVHGGRLHRKAMGMGLNRLARSLTAVTVSDTQCGFKAFRGPVARLLFASSRLDGFGQDVEILDLAARLGLTIAEVPVEWSAVAGSKVRLVRDSVLTVVELLRHRLRAPGATYRMVSVVATDDALDTLTKEIGRLVRATDLVVTDSDAVHVLVCDGAEIADALAQRLSSHFGREPLRATLGYDELRRRIARWDAAALGAALD
jgi:glycosyltransferase involved in cell wall biosynthesis